jgi:hypothetical protein
LYSSESESDGCSDGLTWLGCNCESAFLSFIRVSRSHTANVRRVPC